ncbi:cytochrome c1 [Dokdonella sp.]|uniref:cytochrome c1 n=1 Tax=Dokdonella sp. TaxID=2291710 RepID=UPI00261EF0AA|nr:cytochrome c1 [Dokdonella sp.]
MFAKLAGAALACLMTFASATASEGGGLQSAGVSLNDVASMQRGAKLFFNYCSGCHSLQYLRYSRIAEDLKLDPKDVEKSFVFTGAKIGDQAKNHMPHAGGTQWFGKAPPDLTLEARSKGPDWIYTYLKSFYLDPSRPLGWNNTLFANASMPNPLWELQGIQVLKPASGEGAHGGHEGGAALDLHTPGSQTPEQFDQTARDITAFLQYAAEPAALQRESMGVWVLLYLALFTFIAYLLKHEFWKDVH